MTGRHRVLIAGAGVGGLECALALHAAAGERVAITLIDPSDHFAYRPWSVVEPFTGADPVEVDLAGLAADKGFGLVPAGVTQVHAARRAVMAQSRELSYDSLVLALGARSVPIVQGALTFGGPGSGPALAALLEGLADGSRIAFVVSASAVWTLPAYELALSTAARRPGLQVLLVTAEPEPLAAFGSDISTQTLQLLRDRGIDVHLHTAPSDFDPVARALFVPMAGTIHVDAAVALPALAGRRIPGVPSNSAGFIAVDDLCRVEGLDHVYAVGDMTDRPLKQGGLAAQQADVAAAMIAREAGVRIAVEPYEPVLRALLVTGEGPRYLRQPPAGEDDPLYSPWWPPHKIAATHLGPYLATHGELVRTVSDD